MGGGETISTKTFQGQFLFYVFFKKDVDNFDQNVFATPFPDFFFKDVCFKDNNLT